MRNLLGVLLILPLIGLGQADFTHLSLQVSFEPEQGRVHGEVELKFETNKSLDSLYLNGIQMTYESILFDGKAVHFKADKKGVWIYPSEVNLVAPNILKLKYTCTPRRGIFFVGWNDPTGRARKQIWTQGQGIDHRHWIPHKDDQTDKLIVELFVQMKSQYQVMANGLLEGKQVSDDFTTWHYRMKKPMSSYLIALAIGDYGITKTSAVTGVPLYQYYYPDRVDDYDIYYLQNEFIFNQLQNMLEVPFAWQNYKQAPVANFQHGAMENTTATIWGDFFMADSLALADRNYPYVNAHELAHQWFGNLVTAKNSDHHWLHEGFATYYQWLMEKAVYGQMHFDWERKLAADLVFEASKRDDYPLMNGKAGSYRFYQKGAWVLYMLHQQYPSFDDAVNSYLEKHAFGVVETDDFKTALEVQTGDKLDGFFDFWVKEPYDLECFVQQQTLTKNELVLKLSTTYENAGKNPALPVELAFKNGERRIEYIQAGKNQIELEKQLLYWNANPNASMLMRLTEEKPNELWEEQALASFENGLSTKDAKMLETSMLDCYKAIVELNPTKSAELLIKVLKNEQAFYMIRAEALRVLLLHDYSKYVPLVHQILLASNSDIAHVKLQKEAVKMIQDHTPETMNALEKARTDRSYKLRELAIHKSVLLKLPSVNGWLYDEHFEKEPGIGGQGVYITALTYRYLMFKDAKALDALIDRCSVSYEFLTRMNAIQALQSLNAFDETMLPHLFEGMFNTNRKLLRTARTALKHYAQTPTYEKQISHYIAQNEQEWGDFQKRMVARTFDNK